MRIDVGPITPFYLIEPFQGLIERRTERNDQRCRAWPDLAFGFQFDDTAAIRLGISGIDYTIFSRPPTSGLSGDKGYFSPEN